MKIEFEIMPKEIASKELKGVLRINGRAFLIEVTDMGIKMKGLEILEDEETLGGMIALSLFPRFADIFTLMRDTSALRSYGVWDRLPDDIADYVQEMLI
jgi:hypothetical protein